MDEPILETEVASWAPVLDYSFQSELLLALEQGMIIYLPALAFVLLSKEMRFLSSAFLSGVRKNISLAGRQVRGAMGDPADLQDLGGMIERFAAQATRLVHALFPQYADDLVPAGTSFRPGLVENRETSWRKDDSRLHVDAFPSRPNRGARILRVFSNVNPEGQPRVWRAGEPFADAARRFLPAVGKPLPGSARVLNALRITKSLRSEYDYIMLHLHDLMKADLDYQRSAPQQELNLAAGSTWICFSDQVLHAAMSGQYLFEQTFHLPVAAQYRPQLSPLRVLEQLRGRALG